MIAGSQDAPSKQNDDIVVMKFGGSSLSTAEAIERVAGIVYREPRNKVVVLSAIGKTTNALLRSEEAAREGRVDIEPTRILHEEISRYFGIPLSEEINSLLEDLLRVLTGIVLLRGAADSNKSRDLVASFGERMCVRLFASIYQHLYPASQSGKVITARHIDSWDAGFITSPSKSRSGASKDVLVPSSMGTIAENLRRKIDENTLPVITGFIAKDPEGDVTTLGRDGSDLSASIIGAALRANRVEIWKDVDGVMTTDPRLVPSAKPVTEITFEEVQELAYFGAKVVHPQAILPVIENSIPMVVKNSVFPDLPGTRIVPTAKLESVRAISCKREVTMVDIVSTRMYGQHGFLKSVFSLFDEYQISVDTIATSEVSVSLTLDDRFDIQKLSELHSELNKFAAVTIRSNMALITLIAPKHKSNHVLLRSFEIFEKEKIAVEMLSHGASKVNMSFLVNDECLVRAVEMLHDSFFPSTNATTSTTTTTT